MATLTKKQKRLLVTELATFSTPSEAAETVKDEFGVEVSRQQAAYYDPSAGERPAERWRNLFRRTREEYLDRTSEVGIAHKVYRLERLQRLYRRAENDGDVELAASLLEQAAKEVGEQFTNRRLLEHSGPGGEAIELDGPADVQRPMSKEQKAEAVRDLLENARDRASSNGDQLTDGPAA